MPPREAIKATPSDLLDLEAWGKVLELIEQMEDSFGGLDHAYLPLPAAQALALTAAILRRQMPKRTRTDADKFWNHAERGGINDHWLWLGSYAHNQIPVVQWGGRQQPARKIAWLLVRGPVQDRAHYGNGCEDNRCINPFHTKGPRRHAV